MRIHRSGESGSIQDVLFVLSYEPTIHGTISRFHNSLANFWLSLTYAILSGRDNRRVSLRQVQTSKQDNHGVQRKFAFNRQFVRGSVGTPEGISSISGNHWIQCRAPLLWILDPESIPSISRNLWIYCLAPFILDLGPSRASDCELLCFSKSSVWIVWMLDIGPDHFFIWLNPRGEIYFSLKELIAMFAR